MQEKTFYLPLRLRCITSSLLPVCFRTAIWYPFTNWTLLWADSDSCHARKVHVKQICFLPFVKHNEMQLRLTCLIAYLSNKIYSQIIFIYYLANSNILQLVSMIWILDYSGIQIPTVFIFELYRQLTLQKGNCREQFGDHPDAVGPLDSEQIWPGPHSNRIDLGPEHSASATESKFACSRLKIINSQLYLTVGQYKNVLS